MQRKGRRKNNKTSGASERIEERKRMKRTDKEKEVAGGVKEEKRVKGGHG